jgi:hypothetical protein
MSTFETVGGASLATSLLAKLSIVIVNKAGILVFYLLKKLDCSSLDG